MFSERLLSDYDDSDTNQYLDREIAKLNAKQNQLHHTMEALAKTISTAQADVDAAKSKKNFIMLEEMECRKDYYPYYEKVLLYASYQHLEKYPGFFAESHFHFDILLVKNAIDAHELQVNHLSKNKILPDVLREALAYHADMADTLSEMLFVLDEYKKQFEIAVEQYFKMFARLDDLKHQYELLEINFREVNEKLRELEEEKAERISLQIRSSAYHFN